MDQAREFLTHFSGPGSYFIFYLILSGCGIGLPLNSDLILITASMLAAMGVFKLTILIPIAFLGLLTGDTINFFVARKYGPKLLKKAPFRWILSEAKVKRAETFLSNKGSRFLFFVRFLPLIRTALFFTAGSLQVNPRSFYFLNGASTVIYLFALMNLAHAAGRNIDSLFASLKQFQFALLGAVVFASIIMIRNSRKKGSLAS